MKPEELNEPIFLNPDVKGCKQSKELNLMNPNGKIVNLVLYLYSMELGSPPLYYEINRVCRTMDRR